MNIESERAAFEAWYETTYGISLEPEFRANHFIGYVNDKANHRWTAWQARAALSAPSHGEQVQVEAVAVTREDEDGELYLDWLLEGGISALEFEGQLLLVAHGKVTDESGHGCVIAAAPSAGSQEQGE